jgi:hypothetical protein
MARKSAEKSKEKELAEKSKENGSSSRQRDDILQQ